ncbi:hypothetical protein SLEP1_g12826 [Rubroshorea leprosula]|uniref:Uncharacterized protein n=1 Tax=Rubroshorea leprosula TaxID=152421 RepID=A0AAV5IJN9_9ROSI|nr:hypothetical protein SLEP1_g12826 [Rubroshorea leprosula]
MEIPSSSASRTSMSVASGLKEKLNGLWLCVVWRWPMGCAYFPDIIPVGSEGPSCS